MNAHCERAIGTLRREVLDHLLVGNESHARQVLDAYARHYNGHRPHQAPRATPSARNDHPVQMRKVCRQPRVGYIRRRILAGQAQGESLDAATSRRTAGSLVPGSVSMAAAHEVTVPPQDRVRGDDQVQLPQCRPRQPVEKRGQHVRFVIPRVLELSFITPALKSFAQDLEDCGNPFLWNSERRAILRAELDAYFFHLHGTSRADAEYILDTFKVVRDNDTKAHGTYRTQDLILAEYDRMAAAGLTLETPLTEGESGTYRSTLTPPPGQGPRHG